MRRKNLKKKNSLTLHTASNNNASYYTDRDGFQEHSQVEKPVLQGAHPPEGNFCFTGLSPCTFKKDNIERVSLFQEAKLV